MFAYRRNVQESIAMNKIIHWIVLIGILLFLPKEHKGCEVIMNPTKNELELIKYHDLGMDGYYLLQVDREK